MEKADNLHDTSPSGLTSSFFSPAMLAIHDNDHHDTPKPLPFSLHVVRATVSTHIEGLFNTLIGSK